MNQRATVFEFISYVFEPLEKRILFHYKTEFLDKEPLFFTETVLLPSTPIIDDIPKELLEKILQGLHLIIGISYYKFYCGKNVRLPYELSKNEAEFWNIVYKKGLGEFFYKNKLHPSISPKFTFSKNVKNTIYSLKSFMTLACRARPIHFMKNSVIGFGTLRTSR